MLARFTLMVALALPLAAAPRVSFIRTVPPVHPLGGDEAVIIYAVGDTEKIDSFVDTLLTRSSRSDALRLTAATDRLRHVRGDQPDSTAFASIRRLHPADVYLGINRFTCELHEQSGEGSTRDTTGTRVKQRLEWADAVCRARIDVVDPPTGRRTLSFEVKGEGTSARVSRLSEDERAVALEQAAHFAAMEAADMITPRRVKESVTLEEHVPDLDRALSLIASDRIVAARAMWEKALERMPSSAPLHYNVAALSEALGELELARKHYEQAQRLSPGERRYRIELAMFRRRSARP